MKTWSGKESRYQKPEDVIPFKSCTVLLKFDEGAVTMSKVT
jgi:hypothetical protein